MAPNGIEWALTAVGGHAHRRGPRPAQHAAETPGAEGATGGRRGQPSRGGAGVSRPLATSTRSRASHPAVPLLRHVWTLDALPTATVEDALVVGAGSRGASGRRPRRAVHVGQPGRPQGRDPHPWRRLRAIASGLQSRCVGSDERLYIPMPFFWTGGFSSGLMTVLVAGATLLTEAVPEPDANAGDART